MKNREKFRNPSQTAYRGVMAVIGSFSDIFLKFGGVDRLTHPDPCLSLKGSGPSQVLRAFFAFCWMPAFPLREVGPSQVLRAFFANPRPPVDSSMGRSPRPGRIAKKSPKCWETPTSLKETAGTCGSWDRVLPYNNISAKGPNSV